MDKRGFTLIELLAVIIILSLLITLVLPKITNAVKNYSKKTDALMLDIIEDAAKLYIDDNSNKFIEQNGNNYCILISDLVNENYLKGVVEYSGENITNTKGIKIKYNDGIEYELVDLYKGSCTLANYITNLYHETTTTTINSIEYSLDEVNSLMNDRLGSSDIAKTAGNIRYYGINPNNYIDIGDRDKDGNIIFWRIIGVFKDIEVTDKDGNVVGKEDLVKIIRADKLMFSNTNVLSWDYTSAGEYDNNWGDSTLQVLLNDEVNGYLGSGKSSYYNAKTTSIELDFESIGLSKMAHNKIARVKWNLGDSPKGSLYANVMYENERLGNNSWSGIVALMYPSDYGYSVDLSSCKQTLFNYSVESCVSKIWMHDSTAVQWTIGKYSNKTHAFLINTNGGVDSLNVLNTRGVRPVLYLKSGIGIVEEKETSDGIKYFVVQ